MSMQCAEAGPACRDGIHLSLTLSYAPSKTGFDLFKGNDAETRKPVVSSHEKETARTRSHDAHSRFEHLPVASTTAWRDVNTTTFHDSSLKGVLIV